MDFLQKALQDMEKEPDLLVFAKGGQPEVNEKALPVKVAPFSKIFPDTITLPLKKELPK
jgi:hypothetical protein